MDDELTLLRRSSGAMRLPPDRASFGSMPLEGSRARWIRAGVRVAAVAGWTLIALPVQAVLVRLPGRAKIVFARCYWAGVTRLLGLRVRVIGEREAGVRHGAGRPVVFVSNHSSWLDIPVLGGVLPACFVSKGDVAGWPVIGTIARLGRTVFISRRTQRTGRERDDMRRRLSEGDNLILFPEGTSSDGSRVLPFRTAFFAVADGAEDGAARPVVQPVSVVYDRLAGLPVGRMTRPVFAWYGDMDLVPHLWRLAQSTGLRVTVVLHGTIDPTAQRSRKVLCQEVFSTVADTAARLRQNR